MRSQTLLLMVLNRGHSPDLFPKKLILWPHFCSLDGAGTSEKLHSRCGEHGVISDICELQMNVENSNLSVRGLLYKSGPVAQKETTNHPGVASLCAGEVVTVFSSTCFRRALGWIHCWNKRLQTCLWHVWVAVRQTMIWHLTAVSLLMNITWPIWWYLWVNNYLNSTLQKLYPLKKKTNSSFQICKSALISCCWSVLNCCWSVLLIRILFLPSRVWSKVFLWSLYLDGSAQWPLNLGDCPRAPRVCGEKAAAWHQTCGIYCSMAEWHHRLA